MQREYIITMTAENRVGILAAVTNAMAELGAELLEASQTVVSGYFTMIFAAEFPEKREQQVILDHLKDVCRPFGIEVTVTRRSEPVAEASTTPRPIRRLRLTGQNVPGILRKISVKMSMIGIDIIGMHAFREGDDQFGVVMKITLPESFDSAQLPDELIELDSTWQLKAEIDDYSPNASFTGEQ
jgi:glycine cleavage system transcriptional repressor